MSPDYLHPLRLSGRPPRRFALLLALGLAAARFDAPVGSASRNQSMDTISPVAATSSAPLLIRALLALPILPPPAPR